MDDIDIKKVLAFVISVDWPENFRKFEKISSGRAMTLGLTDNEAMLINEAFQNAFHKYNKSEAFKFRTQWGNLYDKVQNKPVDDLWRDLSF